MHVGLLGTWTSCTDGVTAAAVLAGMSEASEGVLGYAQPVEEKPLGEDVSDGADDDDDDA